MSHSSDPSPIPAKSAEPGGNRPLPTAGFEGTPEEIERQWYEQVYRGRGDSMAQLTWRAVLMGSALGGILSLTNLYIGLKAGWGFGVSITACIVSYGLWTTFCRIGLARTPMTILENNCMQSTASAAGYSTGTTLISAFSAYILINGQALPVGLTLAWVFFSAMLGVTMAIPMKRQMINVEQLRFPTGTAAAETLNALYSTGERGMRAARALGLAGLLAALDKFWAEGLAILSAHWEKFSSAALLAQLQAKLLGSTAYAAWQSRTVLFVWDPIFMAAGALIGIRVCLSMIISATLCWAVYVPILQEEGLITGVRFRDVVQWTLWGGTACMVSAGILSFALQWRSSLRAFRGLTRLFQRSKARTLDPLEAIETPTSWFLLGQVIALGVLAWLAYSSFGMPLWLSLVGFFLSLVLATVACRVTGETDTTPLSAIGQMTQMTVGAIHPGSANTTLMSANVVAGAAISSADLLTDLKSGYLLGANPRKQFLAQFAGIFTGTVVTVLAFQALVPGREALEGKPFAAPSAQSWSAVAQTMSGGLKAMEPVKIWSMGIGAAVGAVLTVLPLWFPKQAKYLPSAAGVGLAWVFHWFSSLMFFLGALIAWIVEKRAPKQAEEYTFPVASGVIAGGSLMGVFLIFYQNGPEMIRRFLGH